MASINAPVRRAPIHTTEGARAAHINPDDQLRRLVLSCLLWEREFYVDGLSIADAIADAVARVKPAVAAQVARDARDNSKLRHVPLWIVRAMAALPTHRALVAGTLAHVIQRADELTEFVALYWKDGRRPLSAQVKKGLARAFRKFDAYQLAKYNRDGAVKLRDVLFLSHAKPADDAMALVWKQLIDGTLAAPDTWEVALSAGADKRATFERLISERMLGGFALLRNVRNMQQAGIEKAFVASALETANLSQLLPFRFIAAARAVPQWEDIIEPSMLRAAESLVRLPGKTVLLIDVSGSMDARMSGKSDLMRADAANGLAILARETCDDVVIYSFSHQLAAIPTRRGFGLADAITRSQPHGGTYLGAAVARIDGAEAYDRLIVITDEQSHDTVPAPKGRGYMINVASNQNGVGYGAWTHIDGFSESVVTYIAALESVDEVVEV